MTSRANHATLFSVLFLACAFAPSACGGKEESGFGDDPAAKAGASNSTGGSVSGVTGGSTNDTATGGATNTGSGGTSSTSTGGTIGTGTGAGGTGAGVSNAGGGLATDLCGTDGCKCSNGIDDDKDGKIDELDPECTGPLDNDEATFATGIPGDNKDPKWQDCFFDGNSGAGDDRCRYHTDCLYGKLPPDDPDCKVSKQCIDYCQPRTPNGCDCFGCCTVSDGKGKTYDVMTIASSCTAAKLADPKACVPCTKTTACNNTCGECELCPGKTIADLDPVKCGPKTGTGGTGGVTGTGGTGGVPVHTCDGGENVCGVGLPACPGGMFCNLGCCLPSIR